MSFDPSNPDQSTTSPTQATQNAQPAQQPVQPNVQQNPAQQQVQNPAPKPQQPQPNSAALNPNTNPVHRSLFDKIFTGLGGGPRYVTQMGPNGQPVTVTVPTSKGDITRSLLAGVIHGMISGYQAGNNTPAGPLGTRSAGIANGLAAGYQAGAANQQQFKNAPQAAMDADMARKATVMNNNVQELRNQLAIGQLHNADWASQEDYYQKTGDSFAPVLDNILKSQSDAGVQLIDPKNTQMNHDDSMKFLAQPGNSTQYTAVQDGWTTETHADGRLYHVPTFSMVKQGDVSVNRDAILALSPYDQGVKQILDKTNGDITLSTGQLLSIEKSAQAAHAGYEALHQWQTSLGVAPEDQLSQSKFNELYRTNPQLKRQVGTVLEKMANIGTQSTDHGLAQLISPENKTKVGDFLKLLNVPPDKIQDYVDDAHAALVKKNADAAADAKRKDADRPADPQRIMAAPGLIKSSSHYLNDAQLASYISKLHPGMSNDELDKVQKEASDENDRVLNQQTKAQELQQNAAAKADAAIAKGEKPVVGVDANGNQVLVPAGDVKKYGLTQVREVGQAENEKVTNARSLMTVFNNTDSDDLGLIQLANNLKDKLGPVASRFQDWLNKGGSVATFDAGTDPDMQRLFTKLGLSTTGLMQVHVGARGSAAMLEHFQDLANVKQLSPQAFIAAIDTENKYVRMKAMMPSGGKSNAVTPSQVPPMPAGFVPVKQ